MKALLAFSAVFLGCAWSLNIPRPTSGPVKASDPCSVSPCGNNANCDTSANGLAFCQCQAGYTGDAFVSCRQLVPASPLTEESPSQSNVAGTVKKSSASSAAHAYTHSNPPDHKVQSDLSLKAEEQDLRRIPILGDSAQLHHKTESNKHSIPHETVVQAGVSRHPSGDAKIQTYPNRPYHPTPTQHRDNLNAIGGLDSGPSMNSIVADPMGQYKYCRNINGVVVCAEISDSNLNNIIPTETIYPGSDSTPTHNTMGQTMRPLFRPLENKNGIIVQPSRHDQDCSNACGENAICRIVNKRPVCGCDATHTGDPGVRCDPIASENPGCQKHTECKDTEICSDSKCIDPCNDSSLCRSKANCKVIQHTLLCGAENVGLSH